MNAQLRPLRPPKRRRDPKYKPDYKPNYVRAAALALGKTLIEYALLIRLHRPIGIWLLMWPALWALWIAGQGRPGQKLLLIYLAGIFVMRSAGCVINDYADRDFDRRVERTRDRPLAAKRVAPGEALVLFIVL
ncbi:MAG: UbiA family prenyltransferase, partial [Gammaproteobacteria bacterium]|nr:UbiA family prenyltransferase [Gammaproteobacteria bacterium]